MVNKALLIVFGFSFAAMASQDPTAPLNWQQAPKAVAKKKVVQPRVPNLQSIVCGESRDCYAILDGHTKATGENIAGFRVKQISADYVTVTRGSKQWKLELFPLEVKQ
ncbi:MSHA biogenesis protein MshK [Vibrio panuliri]